MTPKPKILLVDDRPANLTTLVAVLAQDDRELLQAHSGPEALELLLTDDIALALIDIEMPGMDGVELAELMRGTERTRAIPIIFVTAVLHDQARMFNGYEAGAVDFLFKPVDARILRSKVEVFLELHRQRRQLVERIAELEAAEERLREADRRKDEFLAVLSHELRNPLMPIRTSLYVLERTPLDAAAAQKAFGVIQRQTHHLTRLIDDLLDVQRITSGKMVLRCEPVVLDAIVARAVDDHRTAFDVAGIALETRLGAEPLPLHGDATRLAQIVGNLLGNAAKFTPRGGTVSLALAREDDLAVLRVQDTGTGIASEMIPHLFEPFTQGDRTLDRSRGGLGLGLALVRSLAEMHGGSVGAHSDGPGRGAEFVVRLPLLATGVALPATGEGRVPAATHRRVLVVEDNVDGAEGLRELIVLMGHEVRVAHDGVAAIACAQAFRPDTVLCDIGLPGMDGYEVARRLSGDPALAGTRLVALTGYARPEDRRRARDAGFTEHLSKPPDLTALEKLLS
ncbi:MAG TPA: response regulator [Candidatus Binatia bacterium]|jgi:signal transduction histidine kinase|nr:response regulator [Candidatus Binatia bacterium]